MRKPTTRATARADAADLAAVTKLIADAEIATRKTRQATTAAIIVEALDQSIFAYADRFGFDSGELEASVIALLCHRAELSPIRCEDCNGSGSSVEGFRCITCGGSGEVAA